MRDSREPRMGGTKRTRRRGGMAAWVVAGCVVRTAGRVWIRATGTAAVLTLAIRAAPLWQGTAAGAARTVWDAWPATWPQEEALGRARCVWRRCAGAPEFAVEANTGSVSRKLAARAKGRRMRIGVPGLSIKAIPEYLTRWREKSGATTGRQQERGWGGWKR